MGDHQIHLWQTHDPNPTESFRDWQCLDLGGIAGGIQADQCQPINDHARGTHGSSLELEQFYLDQHHEK